MELLRKISSKFICIGSNPLKNAEVFYIGGSDTLPPPLKKDEVLSLAAVITVNLGVFNLLPIPGLDGCKLLFLAAEGITRRELPLRFQTAINAAGMILLLMLVVLTTMQDVAKYIL